MTICGTDIRYLILMLGLILGVTAPSYAVDGVLEINQACAVNTGCFSGDSAGFPVTIGQAGSYQLTGNLTVPDENTTAIQIIIANVTVNLNGFAIIGPTQCSGIPPLCSGLGNGVGITGSAGRTTVKNGTIHGMGSAGILLTGTSNEVSALSLNSNGGNADAAAKKSGGNGNKEARIVVFGDADFASDAYIGAQGNGNLAFNSVNWLAGEKALVTIRPKRRVGDPLSLSGGQGSFVHLFTVWLMPLFVILAGAAVYVRRRQLR